MSDVLAVPDVLLELEQQLLDELADLRRYRGAHPTTGQLVARIAGAFRPQRSPSRVGELPDEPLRRGAGDDLQEAAALVELVAILRGAPQPVPEELVRAALREAIGVVVDHPMFSSLRDEARLGQPVTVMVSGWAIGHLFDEVSSRTPGTPKAIEALLLCAGGVLARVYASMVHYRIKEDPVVRATLKRVECEVARVVPEDDLLVGGDGPSLVFAPRRLAEEVRQIRGALCSSRTWGDACERLDREHLIELHDWLFGGKDPSRTAADAPLDLRPVHEHGPWPRLYRSSIPGWLPDEVIDRYGNTHSTMMDSGVSFDRAAKGAVIAHLSSLGVNCGHDDDLTSLFIDSEVD